MRPLTVVLLVLSKPCSCTVIIVTWSRNCRQTGHPIHSPNLWTVQHPSNPVCMRCGFNGGEGVCGAGWILRPSHRTIGPNPNHSTSSLLCPQLVFADLQLSLVSLAMVLNRQLLIHRLGLDRSYRSGRLEINGRLPSPWLEEREPVAMVEG